MFLQFYVLYTHIVGDCYLLELIYVCCNNLYYENNILLIDNLLPRDCVSYCLKLHGVFLYIYSIEIVVMVCVYW